MLIIICLAFGNFYYVIDEGDKNNKIIGQYTTYHIANAIMEMYFIAIGNSSTDAYSGNTNSNIIWFFFILASFIIVIVFMNLLISIMGNTLNDVLAIKEQSQTQEQATMIMKYLCLVDLKEKFKNKRYIVTVTPRQDQIQNDQSNMAQKNQTSLLQMIEQMKKDMVK